MTEIAAYLGDVMLNGSVGSLSVKSLRVSLFCPFSVMLCNFEVIVSAFTTVCRP